MMCIIVFLLGTRSGSIHEDVGSLTSISYLNIGTTIKDPVSSEVGVSWTLVKSMS